MAAGRAVGAALAALALAGCGSGDGERPDLVPASVRELPCPFGCAPLRLEVCVDNLGAARAAAFDVTIDARDRADIAGLAAGGQACVAIDYSFGAGGPPAVEVDRLGRVAEADETNNVLAFPPPSGTRCDIVCFDVAPPLPTPPPTARRIPERR